MQVSLVDIGTSKGIRIPASILKMFNKPNSFELHVEDNKIILDIPSNPRSGWEKKFEKADELLINDSIDMKDWDEL